MAESPDASSLDFSDPASIADVGAYATFNAARNAVLSTGAEMCDDITQELCSSFVACSPDYDSDAADELKDDAMDACLDNLSSFNSSCKSEVSMIRTCRSTSTPRATRPTSASRHSQTLRVSVSPAHGRASQSAPVRSSASMASTSRERS